MSRAYSEDLRERALSRWDAGETDRMIAEAFSIQASVPVEVENVSRGDGPSDAWERSLAQERDAEWARSGLAA